MPVRHLDRETGLGNRQFFTVGGDAPVREGRDRHVVSQFLQVGTPEGEALVEEHGAGNADRLPSISWWLERRFQQLVPAGQQILYPRLAVGARALAELVGALVSPVALLAVNGKFLHLAVVGAGAADEVAASESRPVQGKTTEPARPAAGQHTILRHERHADRANHSVVWGNNDWLFQNDRECGSNGVVIGGTALEIDHV